MDKNKARNWILLSILLILPGILYIAPLSVNTAAENESVETPIPETLDTKQTETLAIMLCLDVSGSMYVAIPELKDAANLIVDLLENDTYIGLVTYSTVSYLKAELFQKSNATHFNKIKQAINDMTDLDLTNIDGGLTDCIEQFAGTTYDNKHIVLMTDGYTNTADTGREQFEYGDLSYYDARTYLDHWVNDADSAINLAKSGGICIHSVGFGTAYDERFLNFVANGTDCGQFYDAENVTALAMSFSELANVLEGWSNIFTFYGSITNGQTVYVGRYDLDSGYSYVRISVYWDDPDWNLTLIVKDPNGNVLTPINQSATGVRPIWAIFDVDGLAYIDIFLFGVYSLSMSKSSTQTYYGVNAASKNGKGGGIPIGLIWLYLGIAMVAAILINKKKIKL